MGGCDEEPGAKAVMAALWVGGLDGETAAEVYRRAPMPGGWDACVAGRFAAAGLSEALRTTYDVGFRHGWDAVRTGG